MPQEVWSEKFLMVVVMDFLPPNHENACACPHLGARKGCCQNSIDTCIQPRTTACRVWLRKRDLHLVRTDSGVSFGNEDNPLETRRQPIHQRETTAPTSDNLARRDDSSVLLRTRYFTRNTTHETCSRSVVAIGRRGMSRPIPKNALGTYSIQGVRAFVSSNDVRMCGYCCGRVSLVV